MRRTLQFALELLDEGLAIYRRNFGAFVLLSASWFVPIAILTGLAVVAFSWLEDFQKVLLVLGGLLLLLPLLIYLLAILSRAAEDAIEGRTIQIRAALVIHPLRVVSMTFFAGIYAIVMQILSGIVSLFCICPAYLLGSVLMVGMFSSVGSSGSMLSNAAIMIASLVTLSGNLVSLAIGGAAINSVVYALQPWANGQLRFGVAIEQSLALTAYRFGSNILVCALAAITTGAAGLSVAVLIGLAIPLPTLWLLGEESQVAQAISIAAWLAGLMVIIPPLPIWMALLYRHNVTTREGHELREKIARWEAMKQ